MDSPSVIPAIGTKLFVRELESTDGFMVEIKNLATRRAGEHVTMKGVVPGHGGDLWWCEHDDGDIAAYCFTELEFVHDPSKAIRMSVASQIEQGSNGPDFANVVSTSSSKNNWIEPDGKRPNLPDDAVVQLKFQNEELGFPDEAGIVISMPVRAADWEGAKEKGLVYRVAYRKPEA